MNSNGLAPCRVCGQMVSEYAPACPKCGDPTARRYGNEARKKMNPWIIIGWIILLPFVLVVGSCIGILGDVSSAGS